MKFQKQSGENYPVKPINQSMGMVDDSCGRRDIGKNANSKLSVFMDKIWESPTKVDKQSQGKPLDSKKNDKLNEYSSGFKKDDELSTKKKEIDRENLSASPQTEKKFFTRDMMINSPHYTSTPGIVTNNKIRSATETFSPVKDARTLNSKRKETEPANRFYKKSTADNLNIDTNDNLNIDTNDGWNKSNMQSTSQSNFMNLDKARSMKIMYHILRDPPKNDNLKKPILYTTQLNDLLGKKGSQQQNTDEYSECKHNVNLLTKKPNLSSRAKDEYSQEKLNKRCKFGGTVTNVRLKKKAEVPKWGMHGMSKRTKVRDVFSPLTLTQNPWTNVDNSRFIKTAASFYPKINESDKEKS